MIVITGAGRSGTTALALLYQQLGFDLGGEPSTDERAGLDSSDFWRLNNRLAVAMGMTMLHPARNTEVRSAPPPPEPAIPDHKRRRGGRRRRSEPLPDTAPASLAPPPRPLPRVRLADWDRLERVVEEHRSGMLQLAERTTVVKDSRFLWTLPLWLASGAAVEHVVITVRAMPEMVTRPDATGASAEDGDVRFTEAELRNALSYGLGIATTAAVDSGVSHAVLRFPDFITDLDELYAGLRFPTPVSAGRFLATARRVFDPKALTDFSGG